MPAAKPVVGALMVHVVPAWVPVPTSVSEPICNPLVPLLSAAGILFQLPRDPLQLDAVWLDQHRWFIRAPDGPGYLDTAGVTIDPGHLGHHPGQVPPAAQVRPVRPDPRPQHRALPQRLGPAVHIRK